MITLKLNTIVLKLQIHNLVISNLPYIQPIWNNCRHHFKQRKIMLKGDMKINKHEPTMGTLIPFPGHIKRLIQTLDNLYEFGPTDYYGRFSTMQQCYRDFENAVSGLTAEEISSGLNRLKIIDRERVSPKPSQLFSIFTVTDSEWQLMKHTFERDPV